MTQDMMARVIESPQVKGVLAELAAHNPRVKVNMEHPDGPSVEFRMTIQGATPPEQGIAWGLDSFSDDDSPEECKYFAEVWIGGVARKALDAVAP